MFDFLFKKKVLNNIGHKLFASIIDQSRLSTFYADYEVEDSLDGRFDVMAVHMAMVLDKFDRHQGTTDADKLKLILQEIMFDNLDLTLREIGVGDLGVGKKIKIMAEAFYGRMMVYQDLFKSVDQDKMAAALIRNLYRERNIAPDTAFQMTTYIYGQQDNIKDQKIENVMAGKISFMVPVGVSNV